MDRRLLEKFARLAAKRLNKRAEEEEKSIKPEKIDEVINKAREYQTQGKLSQKQFSELEQDMKKLKDKAQEQGTFESIGSAIGSVLGWAIGTGTILEDFFTLGVGVADDVITLYVAAHMKDWGGSLGKKIDNAL